MEGHGNVFLKKSFVAITGAGRGLGRSIALQFGAKFPPKSVLVLMDRNMEALENVTAEVTSLAPHVNILMRQYDQGNVENADNFKDIFNELLVRNTFSQNDFEQYMIVHNCGTLCDVSKRSLELSDSSSVRKYYDINLTGMILLNTSFFRTFSDSTKPRVVVSMSSAAASTPMASLHLYCAGKAARDMFMRVLAVEEPSLRILTFVPASTETDMMKEFEAMTMNKSMIDGIKQLRADSKMALPDTQISKLVKILEENTFENAVNVESDKLV